MRDEGYISVDSRRFGLSGSLRRKQWWYFEGLDTQQKLYFVFLALQAFPSDYVSVKIIDYGNNRRWNEDHLGKFRAAPGDAVDVSAGGKWGRLKFSGRAEDGWQIEIETPSVRAKCNQKALSPPHRDHLLTQHIDYYIQQFVSARTEGTMSLDGQQHPFAGYGYAEHNWGVQPRHSTAHWLHFWGENMAGVVLSCFYDSGVPHHYTFIWRPGEENILYSPAHFGFDPAFPDAPWKVLSPDLELNIRPLLLHRSRMRIPPVLTYIDIDYQEQLLEVEGSAWVRGQRIPIDGMGKLDFNWNRW